MELAAHGLAVVFLCTSKSGFQEVTMGVGKQCVCVCVCACVHACVRACVCVCKGGTTSILILMTGLTGQSHCSIGGVLFEVCLSKKWKPAAGIQMYMVHL